tara:strand:+ start:11658 stop:12722 length:1065 start_codon:yes stop_codon:yes gene_type:complete
MKLSNLNSILLFVLLTVGISACKHDFVPAEIPETATPYHLEIPKGFPPMEIPNDNPMTEEGVELGRKLFYDKRLSGDETLACASCHQSKASYADSNQFSTGIDGSVGNRNAMAVINVGYSFSLFWDGRAATLEAQALGPVVNPIEMNTTWPAVLVKLNEDTYYRNMFKIAFGVDVIDSLDVAKAIAQFERTMLSGNSRYDKSLSGGPILTESERRGQDIFLTEKGDCFHCHGTGLFMGFDYENNGVQQSMTDNGLGDITQLSTDIGKFKPPTLRNIEFSAPYMHDGRFTTLEEVVEFYNSGVNQNSPNVSALMLKSNRPNGSLNLTVQQKQDLVAFLKTLSDSDFTENPNFMQP